MSFKIGGVFVEGVFFLAFGFLASLFFGFLAFRLLLVYAGFGGFLALAFRILCIPSSSGRRFGFSGSSLVCAAVGGFGFSHTLLSQFLSGRFGFGTLSLIFGFGFPHPRHHQLLSGKCSLYLCLCLSACMYVLRMHVFEHQTPPLLFVCFAPLLESSFFEHSLSSNCTPA